MLRLMPYLCGRENTEIFKDPSKSCVCCKFILSPFPHPRKGKFSHSHLSFDGAESFLIMAFAVISFISRWRGIGCIAPVITLRYQS